MNKRIKPALSTYLIERRQAERRAIEAALGIPLAEASELLPNPDAKYLRAWYGLDGLEMDHDDSWHLAYPDGKYNSVQRIYERYEAARGGAAQGGWLTMEVVTRAEARERGLLRYFTGKPCKHGHVVERYTSYGACVACAYALAMGYRADRPDWWASYMEKWRSENPEKPVEYYRRDPEKYRARRRRFYHQNTAAERSRNRRYKRANPEANVAREQRRRARIRNARGDHTAEDIRRLYDEQGGVCAACPASLADGYHVDHVMPLALGGSNGPENLQLLCPPCNLSKSDKHPDDWTSPNRSAA